MKHIEELIEEICEELDGACDYAEEYIKAKAQGHSMRATKYKSMAEDELTHAGNVKDFAGQDIEEIRRVFELPHEIEEKWEKSIKHYAERVAWIKYMLN